MPKKEVDTRTYKGVYLVRPFIALLADTACLQSLGSICCTSLLHHHRNACVPTVAVSVAFVRCGHGHEARCSAIPPPRT